jgi:hypothetical protein
MINPMPDKITKYDSLMNELLYNQKSDHQLMLDRHKKKKKNKHKRRNKKK